MPTDRLQRLHTILLALRAEPGEREQFTQSLARRVIVIHDQDVAFRHKGDPFICGVRGLVYGASVVVEGASVADP